MEIINEEVQKHVVAEGAFGAAAVSPGTPEYEKDQATKRRRA